MRLKACLSLSPNLLWHNRARGAYHLLETRRAFQKFNILSRETLPRPSSLSSRKTSQNLQQRRPAYSGDYRTVLRKHSLFEKIRLNIFNNKHIEYDYIIQTIVWKKKNFCQNISLSFVINHMAFYICMYIYI